MWSWWTHIKASRTLLLVLLTPLLALPLPLLVPGLVSAQDVFVWHLANDSSVLLPVNTPDPIRI